MEMEMEKGMKRWLVSISQWNHIPNEFSIAMYIVYLKNNTHLSPGKANITVITEFNFPN